MERRRFLRNGGLLGAVVGAFGAGATVAAQPAPQPAVVPPSLPKEDISHLAPPDGAYTLQISGSYLTDEEKAAKEASERMRIGSDGSVGINTSPYLFYSTPKQTHSVSMTVGKDNRLWMKIGDTWHRVALES
jgi:hypothetical protein